MGATDLSVLPQRSIVFPETVFRSGVASDVPLRVEGIVGQTGNIFQWSRDGSTVTGRISANGALVNTHSVGVAIFGPAGTEDRLTNGTLRVQSLDANNNALVLRGSASQSANIMSLQNSAGTELLAVHSDGTLGLKFGVNRQTLGGLEVHTPAVNLEGINVYGRASQSADLQTWRNSVGSKLTRVTSTGVVGISHGGNSGAFDATGTALLLGYADISSYQHGIRTRHHSNQQSGNAIDLYVWKFGTDTQYAEPTARVATFDAAGSEILSPLRVTGHMNAVGTTFNGDVQHSQASYFAGAGWWTAAVNVLAGNYGGTGARGIVVRGSAGQVGALMEYQDSGGGTLAHVNASGHAYYGAVHDNSQRVSIVGMYARTGGTVNPNIRHLPDGTDLNGYFSTGDYNFISGLNTPLASRWWFLEVYTHISGAHWQKQIIHDMTGGNGTYWRACKGGDPTLAASWTGWVHIYG